MEAHTQNFIDQYFPQVEGELIQICGKPKNGKTALATKIAWDYLMTGYTVAANWHIFWQGYDQRESKFYQFLGLLGLKKNFAFIPKENFIYLNPADEELFLKLKYKTDIIIFLDEGHQYLDSYVKTDMSLDRRNVALFTGHFNRTIYVISQRLTAIHASYRDCVNKFYLVQKTRFLFFWVRFIVSVSIPLLATMPDFEEPDDQFTIMGSKELWKKYNFKSMRGEIPRSQPNHAQVFKIKWKEVWRRLILGREFVLIDTPPLPEQLDKQN